MGVILEPRPHPLLAYVVDNIHITLGIPIQRLHGHGLREFILQSKTGPLVDKGEVVLSEVSVGTLPDGVLSKFLLSNEYWQAMEARRRILFFQTDSLVCPNSNYTVEGFPSMLISVPNGNRTDPIGSSFEEDLVEYPSVTGRHPSNV